MPPSLFVCVKRTLITLAFVFVCACLPTASHAAAERTVHGTVLDLDGKPSRNAIVRVFGLNRRNAGEHCHVRTDASGNFTLRFGKKENVLPYPGCEQWDWYPAEKLKNEPVKTEPPLCTTQTISASGVYYFLVNPDPGKHAGIISTPVFVPDDEQDEMSKEVDAAFTCLPALAGKPLELKMQITKGISVQGTVYDVKQQPVKNINMALSNDLHLGTHTGYGGEIFGANTKTDAQGKYKFEHVNSAVSIQLGGPTVWLKTRVDNGEWVEDCLDDFALPTTSTQLAVDVMMDEKFERKISGKVTDEAGHPVADAEITIGQSYHKKLETFQDTHSFSHGKTNAEGKYEVVIDAPFVTDMQRAEKEGYEVCDPWEDSKPVERGPNQYDFVLKKQTQSKNVK